MSGERRFFRDREGEKILLLDKGKKGLLRLVFSRTAVTIFLLAAQVLLLAVAFLRLGEYYYSAASLVAVVVSLAVINRRGGDPEFKITWILVILAAPVFGIPFYFYIREELGHRLVNHRVREVTEETACLSPPQPELVARLRREDPGMAGLAGYLERAAGQSLCDGSGAKYFPTGEETFEEMIAQLERAEKFIFLEFFIIQEGYMLGRVLKILEEKVKAGVEVRMLYDGTCVVGKVPYHYYQEIEKLGVQCRMFAPLRPLVSTHYNNRDHRKILVVDGRVAFTGGINLADEYINRVRRFGHWKDTAVMVTGKAVRGFTLMFLQLWDVAAGGRSDYLKYLNASAPVPARGWVMPYGDIPVDQEHVGQMVYMDVLNRAQRYVHIATPYLILDNDMLTALTYAAKRGVDVGIIVPGIPDKKTAFALTHSYYRELIEQGVKIYEYTPGFIHAKIFVSDDATAVVGSINLDYRSLRHHYECAALLYGCPAVADVEQDMAETMSKCRRLTVEDCKRDKLSRRALGWLLRPLGPLM